MIYRQIKEISKKTIRKKLNEFFKEDDIKNDITTNTFIDKKEHIKANFVAEFDGVFCGEKIIEEAFSKKVKPLTFIKDGFKVKESQLLATIEGPAEEILRKERVVLNLIQRMSGIATKQKVCPERYRKNIQILDTRKTTPGIRIFEKYASKCGGGANHRFNLSKGVMIKDNHIGANKKYKHNV